MSRFRFAAYQVLLAGIVLVALECAARLAFTFYAGPLYARSGEAEGDLVAHAGIGWDRRPHYNGPDICGVHRSFDARGLVAVDGAQLAKEGATRRRIIFVGDSSTYGFCLPTEASFVEVADRLLPDSVLINLGVPGYTSYQGYRQLLKYGPLIKPHIVVISFNFNDRRYVLREGDVDSEAAFAGPAGNARVLERIYLFRLVRAVGTRTGLIRAPVLEATVRLDKVVPRVDPASYRANLIKMVEWARQNGSKPYLLLLADNPNRARHFRTGKAHLDRKEYDAAIKSFNYMIFGRNTLSDMARRYLAIAYRESGRPDQAEQALRTEPFISTYGGHPILEDIEYTAAMWDVAREYNVPLINAHSRLAAFPWVFFDACHFDAEGHKIVGNLLSEVLGGEHAR